MEESDACTPEIGYENSIVTNMIAYISNIFLAIVSEHQSLASNAKIVRLLFSLRILLSDLVLTGTTRPMVPKEHSVQRVVIILSFF